MGKLNLSQLQSLPDILKDSKWNVKFIKMPAISGFSASDIDLRAVTMDVPKVTTNIMELTIRENTIRRPGRKTYSQTVTLTLVETVDARTLQFLKDWRELCNEYDTNKIADRTSREATIMIYHCDDQWQDRWVYKIENAWLNDYTPPAMSDGSSPAHVKIPLVLAYDAFIDNPASA